jgi:peptidyl-prolyl cis-trans isomerase SurA
MKKAERSALIPGRTIARAFCGMLMLTLFLCYSRLLHSDEIDRLLVAVNGKVITEWDLELTRRLSSIIDYDRNDKQETRDAEISRLADLELMRQELKNFSVIQDDEGSVDARLRSLRQAYADKGGLAFLLKQLGLQESELRSYFQLESSILKFVDFRFRPFVAISQNEIKDYYESRLTPQLKKAGIELPPLPQVSTEIEGILREEKVNSMLDQWILEIRRNSRIEFYDLGAERVQEKKPSAP